jgi:NADPH:quinone reductase-like Zn-dependent oxidoreductase
MRAIQFSSYGPIEVLELNSLPKPTPAAGQVRVAVRAVGINPVDYLVRLGLRQGIFQIDFPSGVGSDFAGVVDAIGEGVTETRVGDEVLGSTALSSLADFVVVDESRVVSKPRDLPWEVAGALTVVGMTALGALGSQEVTADDTVLVSAAAGGVGIVIAQLARRAGARVIGTASVQNHDFLRSLGIAPARYDENLLDDVRALAPEGVSVAFDQWGDDAIAAAIELGVPLDRINTVATDPKPFGVRRVGREAVTVSQLQELIEQVRAGDIVLPIDRVYEFGDFRRAFSAAERRHVRGKLVITIEPKNEE